MGEVPKYMSLAAQYGLEDDMNFNDNSGQDEQTVDQEYQAYVMAQCSPKGTDILKFWEVGLLGATFSARTLLTKHRRSTVLHFRLSLRWLWTTCRSKLHPSLANASSRRVLKWTPSRGIV
jgi:hypothetical protein